MGCRLVCIEPRMVHAIWPFVKHLIWEAMKRGDLSSFAAVEANVLAGHNLLWLARDDEKMMIHAAAVTEVSQTEWRKVCTVVAVGGEDMQQWLPLLDGLEQYARAQGCTAMRICGRKGWTRMLKDYREKSVILEKDI